MNRTLVRVPSSLEGNEVHVESQDIRGSGVAKAAKDKINIDAGRIMEIGENEDEDELSYNKKFPDELREEMIARVASVTHLFRLRLVCKAWNAVITSPDLAQLHAAHRHHETPWLLVARSTYTRRPLQAEATKYSMEKPVLHLVCDPRTTMQQWIAPPLPFLAAHSCDLSTCQSHRGLVCCLASTKPGCSSNTVLIFNPITRAYRLLPSLSNRYGGFWPAAPRRTVQQYNEEEVHSNLDVALWRSSASRGHFKVGVCDTATREVRVFDSRKGYWREGSRAPDRLKPRFQGFRDSGNKDTLYWYDVEVDQWFQTRLPRPAGAHTLKWPSIFKDCATATLMLAAVLVQNDGGAVVGFALWALQGAGGANGENTDSGWVEMASTPASLVQGVRGGLHRLRDSKLMCHPKYVCMTSLLRFSPWPWKCFYPWILSFHVQQQQSWEWSAQPLGPKTWTNFHVLSILDPTLLCIP